MNRSMSMGGHKHNNNNKKKKQSLTVNLKVRMDCDGCELKVKNALSSLRGVESVNINRKEQKVTVRGYIEQSKVLKKAKSTGNRAEIWEYVPNNQLVAQPYAPQQANYVRKVAHMNPQTTASVTKFENAYFEMFSDENPNACSIM